MTTSQVAEQLRLRVISGPTLPPLVIEPGGSRRIGRASAADIRLDHPSVSREHAELWNAGGQWLIKDRESRHGTFVRGIRLHANEPTPIAHRDTIGIGPWQFGVGLGQDVGSTITTRDRALGHADVEEVSLKEYGSLAAERLERLMDCAAEITDALEEQDIAAVVLSTLIAGTSYGRAALVRPIGGFEEVELVATSTRAGAPVGDMVVSRSILRAASTGQVVRLRDQPELRHAVSIAESSIQAVLCTPVRVGRSIEVYLYLDALDFRSEMQEDEPAYCAAIARICGLALASLQRTQLERRQQRLEAELRSAHDVQRRILPPEAGVAGPIAYAMRVQPGRHVAGDLFDITAMADHRVAFFLGDVSGKGMGPALLMATAQAYLRAMVRAGAGAAEAVNAVNRYMHERSATDEFISLWLGIVDLTDGSIEYVDAGHGYCVRVPDGGEAEQLDADRGLPVGIDPDFAYPSNAIPCREGDRIVLFSDGVVEEGALCGGQFGMDRALATLAGSTSPELDVDRIMRAVLQFAGDRDLADDVTVASMQIRRCD